jgi:uncharacterized protein (DUF697 family)
LYGYRLSLGRIRELFAIVGVATVAREAARALCKLVPILGWLISGAIAFGGTYGLGVALIAWYGSGGRIDKQQLKKIYQREYKAARERFKSDRDLQNKARDSRSEDDDKEDDEQGMYA